MVTAPQRVQRVQRVLGAVRLSHATEETTSPERQREQIQQWSALHGHTVVHISEDINVSGNVPPGKRDGLGGWLSRTGEFDVLVAAKLDRLTRSLVDFVDLVRWCDANNITLVAIWALTMASLTRSWITRSSSTGVCLRRWRLRP